MEGITIKDRYIWEIYVDFKKYIAAIIRKYTPISTDISDSIALTLLSTDLFIEQNEDAYFLNAVISTLTNPALNDELVEYLKENTILTSDGFMFVLKVDKADLKPGPFPENFKVVEGVRGYNCYGFYYTNDDTNVYLSAVYSLPDCAPGTWELFIGYKDGSEVGEVIGSNMSLEECVTALIDSIHLIENDTEEV